MLTGVAAKLLLNENVAQILIWVAKMVEMARVGCKYGAKSHAMCMSNRKCIIAVTAEEHVVLRQRNVRT